MLPAQTSFAAGEISPRFMGRIDTKGYKEGALGIENLIPTAQGPLLRRGGFKFAYMLPDTVDAARLVPFQVSADDYFMCVFYDLSLLILNKFGEVVQPELVVNPTFNGSTGWTAIEPGSAKVTFGVASCSLVSAGANIAAIRQNVGGLVIGQEYRLLVVQQAVYDLLRLRVGTSAGGAQLGEITSSLATPELVFTATAVSHWIEIASMTSGVVAVLANASVTAYGVAGVPVASPITADLLDNMQFEMSPEGTKMVIVTGELAPQELIFIPPSTFTLGPIVFTAPPASWGVGTYPRTVTFHQGRLWFGGTRDKPASFWASKSNVYYDFTTGPNADDSLAFTIAKKGAIRWMLGAKQLLVGTDFREFVITGGDNTEVITPSSISIQPQSAYGSAFSQPPMQGNLVLYPSADRRRVYSMGYRFEESGWVSTDLAFAAQHITSGLLLQMAFAQAPENILWMIDFEGKLIAMSYDRDNKVVGWHRHPNEQSHYLSICAAKFNGTDHLWAAARINVANVPRVQMMFSPGPFELAYLDHQKTTFSTTPTKLFPGYEHLIGQTVDILADGAVHPPYFVPLDGIITLQVDAKVVTAGIRAKAKFRSLPIDLADASQTTASFKKRAVRAYVQLLSSGKPYINGKRPPDRSPSTPMDLPELPTSQRVFACGLGYDLIADTTVEEDLPIPLSIAGIYYTLAAEGTAK